MNDLLKIPIVLMRGGTSVDRFLASDLPRNRAERDAALLSIMGSGHPLQLDGIGGGNPVTSKVAIIGPSVEGADIDYLFLEFVPTGSMCRLFAQLRKYAGRCRSFAIEAGHVEARGSDTVVRIHSVNTYRKIDRSRCRRVVAK